MVSRKAVAPSSNDTPCFRRLARALAKSHSKIMHAILPYASVFAWTGRRRFFWTGLTELTGFSMARAVEASPFCCLRLLLCESGLVFVRQEGTKSTESGARSLEPVVAREDLRVRDEKQKNCRDKSTCPLFTLASSARTCRRGFPERLTDTNRRLILVNYESGRD